MHLQTIVTLTKIGTKRGRQDQNGVTVEEPAIVIQVEVPVSNLAAEDLAGLLRAVDQDVELTIASVQRGFAPQNGKLAAGSAGAR